MGKISCSHHVLDFLMGKGEVLHKFIPIQILGACGYQILCGIAVHLIGEYGRVWTHAPQVNYLFSLVAGLLQQLPFSRLSRCFASVNDSTREFNAGGKRTVS